MSELSQGAVAIVWAGAAIAFVRVLVSVFLVRGRDLRLPEPASGAVAVPDVAVRSQEAA